MGIVFVLQDFSFSALCLDRMHHFGNRSLLILFFRVDPVGAEKVPDRPLARSVLPRQRTAAPDVKDRVWGPGLCCGRDELEGLG